MKHLIYLAAFALGTLMLTGCSNDEVVSSPENPAQTISFKAMANKSSRTGVVTTGNINVFRVWGCNMKTTTTENHVQSFVGEIVNKNEKTGDWEYDPVQYWAPKRDYYFVALSTNSEELAWNFEVPTEHESGITQDKFNGYGTVTMDVTGTIGETGVTANADRDLVYAAAVRSIPEENITDETAVSFTFKHMLSRIAFTFTNGFKNDNYKIKITNITLSGFIKGGSCELKNNPLVWVPKTEVKGEDAAPISGTATLSFNSKDPVAPNSSIKSTEASNDYKFIIPGKQQTLGISFNVTVYFGDTEYSKHTLSGTVTTPTAGYEPGKSYMLTATINESNILEGGEAKPIKFDVTNVEGWGLDNELSVTY